jgi:MFS family permease
VLVFGGPIVDAALPSIQRFLEVAPADLSRVFNASALTFGALLLVGGRAGDLCGRKGTVCARTVVFTVAALLGGLATSEGVLIAARALQGSGTPTARSPTSAPWSGCSVARSPSNLQLASDPVRHQSDRAAELALVLRR